MERFNFNIIFSFFPYNLVTYSRDIWKEIGVCFENVGNFRGREHPRQLLLFDFLEK